MIRYNIISYHIISHHIIVNGEFKEWSMFLSIDRIITKRNILYIKVISKFKSTFLKTPETKF